MADTSNQTVPQHTASVKKPIPAQSTSKPEQSLLNATTNATAAPEITRSQNSMLSATVAVKEVPAIKVDTGLDVVTLASFAITALIVVATTFFTFRSARNTAVSQEAIAQTRETNELERLRAAKRADNRQEWINTLRSDLAAYVGAVMNTWNLFQMNQGRAGLQQHLESQQRWEEGSKWAYEYNQSLREIERLKAKIHLLLNPNEPPSIALSRLIDEASGVATSGMPTIAACDAIIRASQPILKDEWEKVKGLQ